MRDGRLHRKPGGRRRARAEAQTLPAPVQPQEDGAVATGLGGDLEEEVQTGGGGQDTPLVPGGGFKRSPYSATKRTTDEDGRS